MNEPLIQQRPLRDLVYDRVRGQIVAGSRDPGSSLRDTTLAEELGVSRTPVREAMLQLARDGFLESDHHRGFRVAAIDPVEVRESYPIIAALETTGLRLAGVPDGGALARLRKVNRRLAAVERADERLRIDVEWHRALVGRCGNARLLALLDLQKDVVGRYENRYMDDLGRVLGSVREHEAVLAALEEGDLAAAARRLEEHWRRGMETVQRWVEADPWTASGGAS